jgi:hypothetical protein
MRLPWQLGAKDKKPDRAHKGGFMTRMLFFMVLATVLGCSRNRDSDAAGARIRDTTLTARDTVDPNDTLPRIRDTVPDSTQR